MSTQPISDAGRIIQAVDMLETLILNYFNAAGDLSEKERRGEEILQLFLTTEIVGQSILPNMDPILGLNCPTGQRCVGGVCTGGYVGLGDLSDEDFMKGMVAAMREDLLKYYEGDVHNPADLSSKERADRVVNELKQVVFAGQKI